MVFIYVDSYSIQKSITEELAIMRILPFLLILFDLSSPVELSETSVELTEVNFDNNTLGKTVLIKFFSPHCDHCKAIDGSWRRLAVTWLDHSQGLIGSVDCTVETKLCSGLNIHGLPTILYGDPSNHGVLLQEYKGERDYDELSAFANETLSNPICSPANLDACDETNKRRMLYLLSLGEWELRAVIKDKEEAIQSARDHFQTSFDSMQASYDAESTEVEIEKSRIQRKIKIMKEILEMKVKTD
jgi:thiol-disulfide isomerase/thioredoxin